MASKRPSSCDEEGGGKRVSREKFYMMTLGDTAAISRPAQERCLVYGEATFVNPIMEYSATGIIPLSIPFVPWVLVGNKGSRLVYKPVPYNLSNTGHAIFRMITFSALGSGRVQATEQKFLAMLSILLYAANKCTSRPFFGAWKSQRLKIDTDIFALSPKIASFIWADKEKSPYQTDIYDPYYRRPTKPAHSNLLCMSKMHIGVRTTDTTIISTFVFMCPMCEGCFVANCKGISNTVTAQLKHKAPWRAIDALDRIKHEHLDKLKTIFKTLKRVHLIAGLDSEAHPDVFLSATNSDFHGTLVAHLFYFFPHVYFVREHAFAIDQTAPVMAFGKYSAVNGRFHLQEQKQLAKCKHEILLHAKSFANYGRCTISCSELVHSDEIKAMLPYVSFSSAATSGIFPYHLFVFDASANMFYTTAFVRVWRAIAMGYLKLHMMLTPPCAAHLLQHSNADNAKKKKISVKSMPELRWTNNAPEKTYCYIGNKQHWFYDGECLTYEWLASILDLYEHASTTRMVPTPSCIEFTICGSYYRAACGQTVLDRQKETCNENIVVGGCFTELVELALSSTKRELIAKDAITVALHDDVCDILQYTDTATHSDNVNLTKEIMFGILRAEHKAISSDEYIFQTVTAFCDKVECYSPADSVDAEKAEPINALFIETILGFQEFFTSEQLMGISDIIVERLKTAIHNRYISSVQQQVFDKKEGGKQSNMFTV
jgi:hypothetical protein